MSEPTTSPLPALALVSDLSARAGDSIEDTDPMALAILRMASSVVRGYARQTFADAVPEPVRDVTVEVAFRVWRNPEGLTRDVIDDSQRAIPDHGFFLTSAERFVLDAHKVTPRGGLWTLGVTRNDTAADTVYVPTAPEPSGYPFPWYDADDPWVT